MILFFAWVVFIFWITLLSRNPSSTRSYNCHLFWGFRELITGVEHGKFVTVQYLGNIVLFIPFGFWFPWKKIVWVPVFAACVLSILIEYTQYMMALGLGELDDVVANTVGAVIGLFFYRLRLNAYERRKR